MLMVRPPWLTAVFLARIVMPFSRSRSPESMHPLGDLGVGAERARLPEHGVDQGCLAVVDVRHDRDVAKIIAGREVGELGVTDGHAGRLRCRTGKTPEDRHWPVYPLARSGSVARAAPGGSPATQRRRTAAQQIIPNIPLVYSFSDLATTRVQPTRPPDAPTLTLTPAPAASPAAASPAAASPAAATPRGRDARQRGALNGSWWSLNISSAFVNAHETTRSAWCAA